MTAELGMIAVLVALGALLQRFAARIGMPVLLVFIALGLLVGIDGPLHVPFENYALVEDLGTLALVIIMFSGGFETSWASARTVALRGAALATIGVSLTAGITALGCHVLLGLNWIDSLLIGAVLSSTDAASVFSVLRSQRLGLKHYTDSLLEIESGSNDPMAFLLTSVLLGIREAGTGVLDTAGTLVMQFGAGAATGAAVGLIGAGLVRRFKLSHEGIDMVLLLALAAMAHSGATLIGGNGFLATYIAGIILGNARLANVKGLVSFFEGTTALAQMALFFTLGLLATPSRMPADFSSAVIIALVLTLVARPVAVALVLTLFGASWCQQALVAFAGLRGAASIVFAVTVTLAPGSIGLDLYHVVLAVVILSIAIQGTLLPWAAKVLDMTDPSVDVLRSFSDWSDMADAAPDVTLLERRIAPDSEWVGHVIADYSPAPDELVVMILRGDERIVPHGATVLEAGDRLVISRATPPGA